MILHSSFRPLALLAFFLTSLNTAFAIDTSAEEKTCRDIGFKPKTEKFAECVLELYGRRAGGSFSSNQSKTTTKDQASNGDGSTDDRTCQSYGFRPGLEGYSNCRMQIDMAKREAATAQARYQQELAAYEQRSAELKRQQDRARSMRQIELGLRMMGGQPPVDAMNSLGTGAPISRPTPPVLNQSIRLPNGRIIHCNTFANHTNCN